MLHFDAKDVAARLGYEELVKALRVGLLSDIVTPVRASHPVAPPSDILLVMPSWRIGSLIGVKLTSVFPSNLDRGEPMIHALYTLIDGGDGKPIAVMNGTEITLRRTAALAALATDLLASRKGGRLLVMGTGALAEAMIRSHCALGAWRSISLWGRSADKAARLADTLRSDGIEVDHAGDAEKEARAADVICCVTAAQEPILRRGWVAPGAHVNLFGAYLPTMREADSDLVAAARLYVDNRQAALDEAGDVLIPMGEGRFGEAHILGEMRDLLRSAPQTGNDGVTVFKSVGFGALDLIAAELVARSA
ncbi:MAG: ornithine cyclodeaminase family protein [Beijerinckiaceae bacterium]|nr:ornithine cyclodeaminase family protein [Beijerinckiaceae bacterium]